MNTSLHFLYIITQTTLILASTVYILIGTIQRRLTSIYGHISYMAQHKKHIEFI